MQPNTYPILSMGDPFLSSTFVTYPEYGFYANHNGGTAEDLLTLDYAKVLMDPNTASYQTLLNPDNMRAFYQLYGEGNYADLEVRFLLNVS